MAVFRRVVRALLLAIVAVVIFIEEWGWRPLSAWVERLAHWPPLARFEARLVALSPHLALLLFAAPAVLLFPLKIVALWLMQRGHVALGVFLILAAKLVGTALVGRLFVLLEPKLMQFAWFARGRAWWHEVKARVGAAVRASLAWRTARVLRRAGRRWWRRRAGP